MAKKEEELKTQDAGVAGETQASAPEVPPLSGKDKYRNRYKEANPDLDLDDEEAFYGAANANLDELDGYRKNNTALVGALGKNKALGAMLSAAKDGVDPFEWLAENLGADISELAQNPDYAKKISEAAQRFQDAQEAGVNSQKEAVDNWTRSLQELKKAQEELGLSDDECYQLASDVLNICSDALQGIVSVETFKKFRDGGRYENDVKAAREEGTVAGKNARIQEDLKKSNPAGVPPSLPGSGAESPEPKDKKSKSFFSGIQ